MIPLLLGDLFELRYGKSLRKDARNEGLVPVLGSNGQVGFHNESLVNHPTIIVGRKGSIGEIHLVKTPCWPIDTTYFVEPLGKHEFDLDWLQRLLRTLRLQELNRSAAVPGLSRDDVYRIPILLPPLEDQIRIAYLLRKVEGLIAERNQHVQQLDDLLKSVFLEMFGDPVRNERGWEKKTAIDYAQCIVPGRDKPRSFSTGTVWITTGDLQDLGYTEKSRSGLALSDEEIAEVKARVVPKSSVLLTCVGDLGVVSISAVNMVVNQQLHSFQVSDSMCEEFFMFSLSFQKKYMYQNASQTTVPYMNKTVCNGIPMIRPPKDLQIEFVRVFKAVLKLKSRYQQSHTDLESLYGALSQKAFKGELDVSRVQLPHAVIEGENTVDGAPLSTQPAVLAIILPETELLLPALKDREQLKALMYFWLEAYREQLGDAPFSVERFMAAAETRIADLHPDPNFDLGTDAYDHIKAWVFGALAAGKLKQSFDDAGNRIQIMAAQA